MAILLGSAIGSGCARKPTLKVIVPKGFHGEVSLSCSSFDAKEQIFTVGSDGTLNNVSYPTARLASKYSKTER